MFVQVVTCNLKDMTDETYRAGAEQGASMFGDMPTLVAK